MTLLAIIITSVKLQLELLSVKLLPYLFSSILKSSSGLFPLSCKFRKLYTNENKPWEQNSFFSLDKIVINTSINLKII